MGSLKSGDLLWQAADEGFAALITMDKRVPEQQNLARIGLAIVIIRALLREAEKQRKKQ